MSGDPEFTLEDMRLIFDAALPLKRARITHLHASGARLVLLANIKSAREVDVLVKSIQVLLDADIEDAVKEILSRYKDRYEASEAIPAVVIPPAGNILVGLYRYPWRRDAPGRLCGSCGRLLADENTALCGECC